MRVERTVLLLAATVLATGCEPTDHQGTLEGDLLQLSAEARDGKVYLLAPATDSIVEVDAAARDFRSVEVGRGPTLMSRPPTSDLLYTLERQDSTISRLGVDGSVAQWELGAPFTTLSWSPDGTRAVAWIDPAAAATIEVEGSLNLNAYAVLQETEGGGLDITSGSLTYEPSGVTFSADSRFALMTSSARLHVLDLDADPIAERAVPFSADEAVHRTPDLVVPAPDGARALVTVEGVQDLFVLSLNPVLIENVIGLERAARDVVWSRDGSRAILADGSNRVTFLDLDSFDVEVIELPHNVTRIQTSQREGPQFALLYSDQGTASYLTRVELTDEGTAPDDPEVYLLEDAVVRVALSPGETAAVIFHDGGTAGADFVPAQSLSLFHFGERAPSRILLDAPAWDLIFLDAGVVDDSGGEHVIVVLKDSARLVRYNLLTYAQVVLDTYPLPHAIGRVPPPEGGSELLYVIHDQDLGLVSFLPPDADMVPSGGFPAVAGLASSGLLEGR